MRIIIPVKDESLDFELWRAERTCKRHKPYLLLSHAERARKNIQTATHKYTIIYLCGWCGEWHVGKRQKGVNSDGLIVSEEKQNVIQRNLCSARAD